MKWPTATCAEKMGVECECDVGDRGRLATAISLSQWPGLTESADSSGGTLPEDCSATAAAIANIYCIYMGSNESTICGAKVDGTRF